MAQAQTVTDQEWQLAIKINTTVDYFNFLSRDYISKNPIPAEKIHPVEFFIKP